MEDRVLFFVLVYFIFIFKSDVAGIALEICGIFGFEVAHPSEGGFCQFFESVYCGVPPWFVSSAIGTVSDGGYCCIVYNFCEIGALFINVGWTVIGVLLEFFMEDESVFSPFGVGLEIPCLVV